MKARSVRAGAFAGVGLALFYVVVVAGASGSWRHLVDQVRQDWYYLVPIVAGFGVQVGLLAELRRRRRLRPPAAVVGGVGAGASGAGMVACCAHHLAEFVPFLGATGAAAFLTEYRVAFILVGIGVNAAGVAVVARKLHRSSTALSRVHPREGVEACNVAA